MDTTFREQVGVLDKKGGRNWIYAKKPKGYFYNWRKVMAFALLIVLFATPFIKINGHPFMLFNIVGREFIIFGVPFFPQDFYIFALVMLLGLVFIALFTVAFGRLFCGWVCPQTIFMEFVFRRIEYWIEGDASQQKKLNALDWTTDKILKKTTKHILFFLWSFWIANTFLAYFIGVDALWKMVEETPIKHAGTFFALVVFTGAFYGNFAFFRELSCIVVCPYGRMQSVLLDKNSLVVAYNYLRGEPRGKIQKNQKELENELENTLGNTTKNTKKGDCVDCGLCVQVCPTGIDIRNGTQMECVNCTACIDACDEVMLKIDKPLGLITYASDESIKTGQKFQFTTRILAYSIVLLLLSTVVLFLLLTRPQVQVYVLKAQGTLFYEVNPNTLANLYNGEFVNKTFEEISIEIKPKYPEATIKMIGEKTTFKLQKQETKKATFFIEMPRQKLKKINTNVVLLLLVNGKVKKEINCSFLGQ